jgi:ADP-heptose:LPS heptosyltransferase
MRLLEKINGIRGALMRRMTNGIRLSRPAPDIGFTSKADIKRILICRPNHRLGNLLLITPLLQEVIETFPLAKIDLFVKGSIAPSLFKNYTNINRIIQLPRRPWGSLWKYVSGWFAIRTNRYDLVINAVNHSASGRLSTKFANSRYKFFGDINEDTQLRFPDHEHMAKYPVYSFRRNLLAMGFNANKSRVAFLDLNLSSDEIAAGKRTADALVQSDKKIICLFTHATGDKCYSESWWMKFYERLKSEYEDYNIIEILPVENVSQISFLAPSFYSKNLREIGGLIANAEVFIGADSGMMHLASAAKTPTVGLFQKTNTRIYEPYNPGSVAINTGNSDCDECIRILNRLLLANTLGKSSLAV